MSQTFCRNAVVYTAWQLTQHTICNAAVGMGDMRPLVTWMCQICYQGTSSLPLDYSSRGDRNASWGCRPAALGLCPALHTPGWLTTHAQTRPGSSFTIKNTRKLLCSACLWRFVQVCYSYTAMPTSQVCRSRLLHNAEL